MAGLPPETRLLYQFNLAQGEFQRISEETRGLRRALLGIGFPSEASRRALIAAYELGMNIVIHARNGLVSMAWRDGAIEICARDSGPGIPDVDLAMREGYSTAPDYVREMGFGAGMGLPNAKKSSDHFLLESTVGVGTTVTCLVLPGPADTPAQPYFHSVQLDANRCKGCTNCIKGCPTEAIRVRGGKAFILQDRCIDCGECIRRCPNYAKSAITDSLASLEGYDRTIALIPPSFYGNFRDLSPDLVRAALTAPGGFHEVFDVAVAADLVSEVMREYMADHPDEGPFISPSCPAVLRLIQVKYPSLLRHVIPAEAPMEIAAWLAKTLATADRGGRAPTTVFISPCPAKITAARQPVGRGRSLVDAVVSSSDAKAFVETHKVDALEGGPGGDLGGIRSTGLGLGWGRSGGEMKASGARGLIVDGIKEVSSVLDRLEKGAIGKEVLFIEASACPGGCAGGCLHAENPYVARMRISNLARTQREQRNEVDPKVRATGRGKPELWFSVRLQPRPIFRLDADPVKAEQKLRELQEIESELPGLDCGACGAPTCRALAEDIVLGRGTSWDCTFKLRERLGVLAEEVKDLASRRPPAMAGPSDDGDQRGQV